MKLTHTLLTLSFAVITASQLSSVYAQSTNNNNPTRRTGGIVGRTVGGAANVARGTLRGASNVAGGAARGAGNIVSPRH